MGNPSIRSLAEQLKVSIATVSLALRDSPLLLPKTKKRIQQAALRAGYQPNPLVRSVMSALRRASHDSYHGALMVVAYSTQDTPALNPYQKIVYKGAQQRAVELGYSIELCWVGPKLLSLARLGSILRARRVQGVVVIPFPETVDFSGLDWTALAAVVIDYCVSAPILHTVLPDHQSAIFHGLERLAGMGYRRPGLVLERWRDERIKHRWSAGYGSFFHKQRIDPVVPLLMDDTIERDVFVAWYKRHKPDVVLGHLQEPITSWLRACGASVPRDVGYFQLNWSERSAPCAGLDPQPSLLGSVAVDSTIAQLHRNERGVPLHQITINLPLLWIDGPTVRAAIASNPRLLTGSALTVRPVATVPKRVQ